MANIIPQKEPIIRKWLSLLCLVFLPSVCLSQIVNGSFEIDQQPSLENWLISCDGQSFQDAPPGGGNWSLRLPPGNFQGCYPGTGSQIIAQFRNGDIWQISVWARQHEKKPEPSSIYLKIIHANGDSSILSVDTTTSAVWTQLTVIDTLRLKEGDRVAVVLDAGLTSGPERLGSYSYFDLVEASKIGQVIVSVNNPTGLLPKNFRLYQNFPNPFNPATTLRYDLPKDARVNLTIYNLPGQEVRTLVNEVQSGGSKSVLWDGKGDSGQTVSSGFYFYRLQAGKRVQTKKMLFLR